MKVWLFLLIPLLIPAVTSAGSSPRELFRDGVYNFKKDQLVSLRYSHLQTDDTKNKGVDVSLVTTVGGSPYDRVISRNGTALTGSAEKKEEEKYQRMSAERAQETDADRQKRLRKYEDMGKVLDEAPEAFDFTMLPEESIAGRPCYVMELVPNPSYQPHNMRLKMFVGLQSRVWIDKQDTRIVKAEATVVDTIALVWVMVRIEKGGHLSLEQMRLPDGTWAVRKYVIDGMVRILLVDEKRLMQTVTFSGYKQMSGVASTQVAERTTK